MTTKPPAGALLPPPSPSSSPPPEPPITRLPAETIYAIVALLDPINLARLCQVCRFLHAHASADRVWQAHVQANVPNCAVTSPYPYANFRTLYAAHELHWFLPRHRLWFSGKDMVGRLVLMRYDPRRGCIEGCLVLATNLIVHQYWWPDDPDVHMADFFPDVRLHLDLPVVQIDPPALRSDGSCHPTARRLLPIPMRIQNRILLESFLFASRQPPSSSSSSPLVGFESGTVDTPPSSHQDSPDLDRWPPPPLPSEHRIHAPERVSNQSDQHVLHPVGELGRPMRRTEVNDRGFYLRTDVHFRSDQFFSQPLHEGDGDGEAGTGATLVGGWPPQVSTAEFETFATIDAYHYTPTPDKPYRGIWVGDYGSHHGCEFLLMHQPDDDGADSADNPPLPRYDGEDDATYAARAQAARANRGRLEAIKLTGDPNVPCSKHSFIAPDLGAAGFISEMQDPPFAGVRIVKCWGQVADHAFTANEFIDAGLLLISPDRLAVHWIELERIKFFRRLLFSDIDRYLDF